MIIGYTILRDSSGDRILYFRNTKICNLSKPYKRLTDIRSSRASKHTLIPNPNLVGKKSRYRILMSNTWYASLNITYLGGTILYRLPEELSLSFQAKLLLDLKERYCVDDNAFFPSWFILTKIMESQEFNTVITDIPGIEKIVPGMEKCKIIDFNNFVLTTIPDTLPFNKELKLMRKNFGDIPLKMLTRQSFSKLPLECTSIPIKEIDSPMTLILTFDNTMSARWLAYKIRDLRSLDENKALPVTIFSPAIHSYG